MKREFAILMRWTALVLASLTMFGSYYMYDSVAYVQQQLKNILGFTSEQFGWMYSAYSIAAIAVLFFGGLFIDRFGTRLSILIFGFICTIAGFFMAFSHSLIAMLLSRVVLGFGAEPLVVAVTVAVAKWFKGRALGFALGINLLIARLGSSMVDWSPTWGHRFYIGYQSPLILASLIGLFCTFGAVAYYFMESTAEKKLLLGKAGETDKLQLTGLFEFNRSFWYITILCVTFYSAIFPFRGFAPVFYQDVFGVTNSLAGKLNSILPITTMIATPLIGLLIDKIGRRAGMMFLGSIILLPVYLMMAYTHITLFIPVAMLGISFSLIPAIMWPSVAFIVEEKRLGTAYALMMLIQQLGLMLFAGLIGWANDYSHASASNPNGYNLGMWFFSILGIVGLVFSFLLRKEETGPNGHGLEKGSI
jgi:MFS family permease